MQDILSNTPVFMVGCDLDLSLVKRLTKGDHVLLEMNGGRIFSKLSNRCVTKERWMVVSCDQQSLVLRHDAIRHDLVLPFDSLLRLSERETAVFSIRDTYFGDGPKYVILQFSDYALTLADAEDKAFDAELLLQAPRKQVLMGLVKALRTFSHPGWGYRSVCRFALRSDVRAKIINAFRTEDWEIINSQSDKTIVAIAEELSWLPLLENNSVAHCGEPTESH